MDATAPNFNANPPNSSFNAAGHPANDSVGKTIIRGLIFMLPLTIMIVAFYFLLQFLVGLLSPISTLLHGGGEPPLWLHLLSLILLLGLLYGAGLIVGKQATNRYVNAIEQKYIARLPFYTSIKETVGHFTGAKEMPFKYVVLVDIYGSGTMMTGFVTQNIKGCYFTVFIPTAPNPMNGNIYHVPRERVTFVGVRPEVAMKSVIGMGTASDHLFKNRIEVPYTKEEMDATFLSTPHGVVMTSAVLTALRQQEEEKC